MVDLPSMYEAERYAEVISHKPGDAVPSEKLLEIYELFGGVEQFRSTKLSHELDYLRSALIASSNFPVDSFVELLNAIPKLTRSDIQDFAQHPHAVEDWNTFSRLWSTHRDSFFLGLMSAETSAIAHHPNWGKFSSSLPIVHDEHCLNGKGQNHHWCFSPRLTAGDKIHDFYVELKKDFETRCDPDVLATIRAEVLTLTEYTKERYAESILVDDKHWHLLLGGKRPILNAVASNRLLPTDYAYEIIREHKTPGLRIEIARNAASKELLDFIWDNTKSEAIRNAVVHNALSGRYLTNPEFLTRF